LLSAEQLLTLVGPWLAAAHVLLWGGLRLLSAAEWLLAPMSLWREPVPPVSEWPWLPVSVPSVSEWPSLLVSVLSAAVLRLVLGRRSAGASDLHRALSSVPTWSLVSVLG